MKRGGAFPAGLPDFVRRRRRGGRPPRRYVAPVLKIGDVRSGVTIAMGLRARGVDIGNDDERCICFAVQAHGELSLLDGDSVAVGVDESHQVMS